MPPWCSVEQAIADPTAEVSIPVPARSAADELSGTSHHAHQILSAIISHHSVPATLQMVADSFVTLYPSKAVAIFLRSGPRFHIGAEAGLPKRLSETRPDARFENVLQMPHLEKTRRGTFRRWGGFWTRGLNFAPRRR